MAVECYFIKTIPLAFLIRIKEYHRKVRKLTDVHFNGRKENLHSLWDTALVELEQGTPAEVAARIESAVTDEERIQWQGGTPVQWALESLAVVRSQVYLLPPSGEVKPAYIEKARAVIRTRMAQAGVRLAWLVNETLRH